jgi:hypothetical protein
LGDFLYFLFRWQLPGGAHAHKESGHALAIEAFLQRGSSTSKEKHSAGEIIEAWLTCPWGHVKGDEGEDNGFEMETPYHEIKPIRQSFRAFAVQMVQKKLEKEADKAVSPGSELHARVQKRRGHNNQLVKWKDILDAAQKFIRKTQPVTWSLLTAIACRKGVVCIKCPVDVVCSFY